MESTSRSSAASSAVAEPMKWWGWGAVEKRLEIGPGAQAMLRAELGESEPAERAALEDVALPDARPLPDDVVARGGRRGAADGA